MPTSDAARATVTTAPVVLIVDDEPVIRRIFARNLVRDGYRVLEAGDGDSALRQVRCGGIAVDVLVTDLLMPDMDGHELACAVRDTSPATRVVYVSGSAEAARRLGAAADGAPCLQKPFHAATLLAAVRSQVGSPAA